MLYDNKTDFHHLCLHNHRCTCILNQKDNYVIIDRSMSYHHLLLSIFTPHSIINSTCNLTSCSCYLGSAPPCPKGAHSAFLFIPQSTTDTKLFG